MLDGLSLVIPFVLGAGPTTQPTTQPATTSAPATMPDDEWTEKVADLLGPTFKDTTWLGWVTLLVGIAAGFAASRVMTVLLKSVSHRLRQRQWNAWANILDYALGPARLTVFTLGLTMGVQGLKSTPDMADTIGRLLGFLIIVAIGWFLFNLVDLLDLVLRKFTAKHTSTHLDETLLVILRKTLRVFLLVMFVLFVAQNTFGANITTWLAGLGIAGLAVSLAAQDSVKNLFGSITVLMERPFSLGDRIVFGAYDGTVETIGFRSTKIRTTTGNLVTVPNMKFTDGIVENISARPYLARTFNLTLVADTSPDKVRQALEIVRGILNDQAMSAGFDMQQRPPRVYFNQINTDSLNINVSYWYDITAAARDPWTYQEHAEEINLRIIQALADAHIELSVPTYHVALAPSSSLPSTERDSRSA